MAKSAAKAAKETTSPPGPVGGFPPETFAFLEGISVHNEKPWFEANRTLYDAGYVEPAKAMVAELGPRLRAISPDVQFEPRVNGSIARINRDIRFSKDKRPYKDHLDLWFWHGDKRGWDMPGFWFRLTPKLVYLGSGMYGFDKERLEAFRQSVVHPRSGKALVALAEEMRSKGYELGGRTRKLIPPGFKTDDDRAGFLLFEGFHVSTMMDVAEAAKPGFADVVFAHFAATKPVNDWLMAEVMD